MTAITISREFASGGETIARQVALALGYHCVDKQFIGALLSEYGLVEFDQEYDHLPGFWEKFGLQRGQQREIMVDLANRVVRAVAKHGNVVILGRNGYAILNGFSDVLHVRLQAPFSMRVERLISQQQIYAEQAETVVKESDRIRQAFVEEFYGVSWDAIHLFDLVINTDRITPELAAGWIVEAAKACAAQPMVGRPNTGWIEVDPVLVAAVSEKLGCAAAHQPLAEAVLAR
jgi:cytidylate kinase